MNKIKLAVINFNCPISIDEINRFRGAVIKDSGGNVLFHNHKGDNFRYAYPLIQYKRINKKASLVCLNDGTDAIHEFFKNSTLTLMLGGRQAEMEIENISVKQYTIQAWDKYFNYVLRKWIPFNQENYLKFKLIENDKEKISFLEKRANCLWCHRDGTSDRLGSSL